MAKARLLVGILSLILVLPSFSQASFSQQKPFPPQHSEVKVRLVIVDVIVTKDGEFVTDLAKDDFEIYEDGVKMPINSFELICFSERKTFLEEKEPIRRASEVPKKQLVVLFDGICSWTRSLRQGARRIVNELVSLARLGNEVMIIQITERKGLEVLQPFTTDESAIRRAIARASGSVWPDRSEEAMSFLRKIGLTDLEIAETGVSYTELVKPFLEDEYLFIWRRRFEKIMGGLFAVANIIKDLPGRKPLLLISDGFPEISAKTIDTRLDEIYSGKTSGAQTPHLNIRKETDIIRLFDPFNILQKKKNMSAEEVIREFIRFANANNISLYVLDPETWMKYFLESTAETFMEEETKQLTAWRQQDRIFRVQNLRWLAEDTGGSALIGSSKYREFADVLKTDLNYYCQLSYYPPRKEPDNAYHKIEVKVKRPGCEVRARKGYADLSVEEERRLRLVSAFYNPELFKNLPFTGEFAFFYKGNDKFEPWINIALPTKDLILARADGLDSLTFTLHVWIKSKLTGEKAFGGQINLPFKLDDSFREMASSIDYLCFHYKTAEMSLPAKDYEAVFALHDSLTEEIGTWSSTFSLPDLKKDREASIFNFITGVVAPSERAGNKTFSISKDDGALVYGNLRFYPNVTNCFGFHEEAFVFLQAYLPGESSPPAPEFFLFQAGKTVQPLAIEIVASSLDRKARVWSALVDLNVGSLKPGEYVLKISLPLSSSFPLSREIKLAKMSY